MIPQSDRRGPDFYRFDNPSSVAAADGYQMTHWTRNSIARHLRLPHQYFGSIHEIINARAILQYADKSPQEHVYRRLVRAEVQRLRNDPLTDEQREDIYLEQRGIRLPQTRNFDKPRQFVALAPNADYDELRRKQREERVLEPGYGELERLVKKRNAKAGVAHD